MIREYGVTTSVPQKHCHCKVGIGIPGLGLEHLFVRLARFVDLADRGVQASDHEARVDVTRRFSKVIFGVLDGRAISTVENTYAQEQRKDLAFVGALLHRRCEIFFRAREIADRREAFADLDEARRFLVVLNRLQIGLDLFASSRSA